MADIGKTIEFIGKDSVSNTSGTIKRGLVDMHSANAKGLKESTLLNEKENKLLADRITLLERIARITKDNSSISAKIIPNIESKFFKSEGDFNKETIHRYAAGGIKSVDPNANVGNIEKILLEILNNDKIQHKETLTHHMKDDEEAHKAMQGPLGFLGREAHQAKRLEHIESINEKRFKRNDGSNIRPGGGGGPPDGPPPDDGESKDKSDNSFIKGAMTVLAAGLGINLGGKIIEEAADILSYSTLGKQRTGASAKTFEEYGWERTESMPFVGSGLSYAQNIPGLRRQRAELSAFEEGGYRTAATTGEESFLYSSSEAARLADLGVGDAEAEAGRASASRMRGRKATTDEMYNSIYANKVLGLDQGSISSVERQSRYGANGNTKDLSELVLGTMGGSQAKLNENMEELVSLGKQHLNVLGHIDHGGDLAMTKAWQSGGQSLFQNAETREGMMSTFRNAAVNPANQFQQAQRFAMLSENNPGLSYEELMEKQEQIGTSADNGMTQAIFDQISQQYGGDANAIIIELKSGRYASTWQGARQLYNTYKSGTLKNISSKNNSRRKTGEQIKNIRDPDTKKASATISHGFIVDPDYDVGVNTPTETLEKQPGSPADKFAVKSNEMADQMQDVAAKAKVVADALKESAAEIKAANDYLKTIVPPVTGGKSAHKNKKK
jgi:hypothetical protein